MRRLILMGATLAVMLGIPAGGAQAAPGDLDPSFGTGGTVSTNIGAGTEDTAGDVAIDSGGNVVVAGSSHTGPTSSAAVIRYTPSGTLDPSFGGGDGIVSFDFGSGNSDYVRSVAIDSSDRIVLGGSSTSGSLDAERKKLLEAFYADALPVDLLRTEQQRIEAEIGAGRTDLARAETDLAELDRTFTKALGHARRMEQTYREAADLDRRHWNQGLFLCFRIPPDQEAEPELREEFRLLTAKDTPRRLRAEARRGVSLGRGPIRDF